jgi:predicted dehydrogenase
VSERVINFGVIGCGLMGREFASAAARWNHLLPLGVRPRIVAACDTTPATLASFVAANPGVRGFADFHQLLAQKDVEALYIAVPHNLHKEVYLAAIAAGKHFLGEKPFGIDHEANHRVLNALAQRPELCVRCSSEFPFFPGALKIARLVQEGKMGRILEVRSGLLHSSDMDPLKPINWKRRVATNGEYGCMGDLGMHAVHLPFRLGFAPRDVRASLSKVVRERPDGSGGMAPCETWDNALLLCSVPHGADDFPMILEMKRIAPGHMNTWFIEVYGTEMSARFSTQRPRTLEVLAYQRGSPQAWSVMDIGYDAAYPAITGAIFEFGFADAIQQMWAAYCDELAHGASLKQPFRCATPEETAQSHALFTAALKSAKENSVVRVG